MDLEDNYDYVTIYQCADSHDCADPYGGEMVTQLTGSDLEQGRDAWIVAQGAMRVHFTSDSSVRRAGFRAVWISSLNSTDPEGSGPGCALNEWPYTHFDVGMQSCELPRDWERLKADAYSGNLVTGGLGQKIILDPYTGAPQFDTWVCHYSHQCARRAGSGDTPPTSAVTARECRESCFRAGYGHEYCGTGTGLLDEYLNGGNALSCVAACMVRVGGRLPLDSAGSESEACENFVSQIDAASTCEFEMAGRLYNVCGEAATCPVPPTLESGLYGCEIGAMPSRDQIDPFCWVYNEKCGKFEMWGWASTIGLD